jgi:hypothetical protein
MKRESVLRWFAEHPEAAHDDPGEIVSRCERAVRRHTREIMWLAAKAYAAKRRLDWEQFVGAHASEAYTAREVCHEIAYGLRSHEPSFERVDAERLAGGPVKNAVDPEGWQFLLQWIIDLALEEGHEIWEEIVLYTDEHARELIRAHHLSHDCSLNRSRCYGEIASRIASLLEQDYAAHAFPH